MSASQFSSGPSVNMLVERPKQRARSEASSTAWSLSTATWTWKGTDFKK
jgi:hypothetical protein